MRKHNCLLRTITNKATNYTEIVTLDCMPDNNSHKELVKDTKSFAKKFGCIDAGLFTWESDKIRIKVETQEVDLDDWVHYHPEKWKDL